MFQQRASVFGHWNVCRPCRMAWTRCSKKQRPFIQGTFIDSDSGFCLLRMCFDRCYERSVGAPSTDDWTYRCYCDCLTLRDLICPGPKSRHLVHNGWTGRGWESSSWYEGLAKHGNQSLFAHEICYASTWSQFKTLMPFQDSSPADEDFKYSLVIGRSSSQILLQTIHRMRSQLLQRKQSEPTHRPCECWGIRHSWRV